MITDLRPFLGKLLGRGRPDDPQAALAPTSWSSTVPRHVCKVLNTPFEALWKASMRGVRFPQIYARWPDGFIVDSAHMPPGGATMAWQCCTGAVCATAELMQAGCGCR